MLPFSLTHIIRHLCLFISCNQKKLWVSVLKVSAPCQQSYGHTKSEPYFLFPPHIQQSSKTLTTPYFCISINSHHMFPQYFPCTNLLQSIDIQQSSSPQIAQLNGTTNRISIKKMKLKFIPQTTREETSLNFFILFDTLNQSELTIL